MKTWIVSQLGSREHYNVAGALHAAGVLKTMFTDVWMSRGSSRLLRPFVPSLASRRHDDLPDVFVQAALLRRVAMDAYLRLSGYRGWNACIKRNDWYSEWVARQMQDVAANSFFSYAYTARRPFEVAKRRGMRCVLDQIDGAWREEQLWRDLSKPYHYLEAEVDQAPKAYWATWQEEFAMADVIVVNSGWSKKLIIEAGADEAKIVEIPLVYSREAGSVGHGAEGVGHSPDGSVSAGQSASFPKARLRALFLGSVCLRKGVGQLFEAIRLLKTESVEFTFAGPMGVRVPDDIRALPNIRFLGPVDRPTAERLYRESDVFLFPTLSDGFGRTQLEALGHGVPVIASTNCGQVVEHMVNGLVLPEVTPDSIAAALVTLQRDRDLLAKLQSGACVPDRFHPRYLPPALLALEA